MSKWIIFVLFMILCILMVICYALIVAASDADDRAEAMREAYKLQDLKTRKKPFKSVWVDENFNELGEGEEDA